MRGLGLCAIAMLVGCSSVDTSQAAAPAAGSGNKGPVSRTISLNTTGPGAVNGAGLSGCRGSCSFTATDGAAIALTAAPDPGAVFSGWSGACSGTGSCAFAASSDAQVTATFAAVPPPPAGKHNLLVSKNGSGSVRSSPAGVDCGGTCAAPFDDGTVISLTATPDAGWTFAGWSGACSGTGACSVSLSSDVSVSASFTASPPPPDECAGLAPQAPGTPVRVQIHTLGRGCICHAGHADGQGNLALSYHEGGFGFLHFFDASGKPLGNFARHFEELYLAEQAEGYLFLDSWFVDWVKASGQVAGQSLLGVEGHFELMDDPTGGVVVYQAASPSSIEAYDAHAALRWKVQRSDGEISVAYGVDRVGNTLLITRVGDTDTFHGTWFDHDGKQQPGSVPVPNYGTDPKWPYGMLIQLVPRVGSGFFLQSLTGPRHSADSYAAFWKGQIDTLGTVITDPPVWLFKYDHRKMHPARGGTAYAFIDQSGYSLDCTQRIEVVATTGKSCGSARFNAGATGACLTASIDVAWDGTVVQQLSPSTETHASDNQTSCTWQAWSGLLR